MNKSQMINEFPKNSFTFYLTDENFQEFYNYLTNEEGKKYPKGLEKILIRRKPKIGSLFLKIKSRIFPKNKICIK